MPTSGAQPDTVRLLQWVHDTLQVVVHDTLVRVAEPHRGSAGFFGRLSPFELLISTIAIANAGFTLYKSFLERAAIRLFFGEHGSIVLSPGDVGRKLHLPCNFTNDSAKMGVVHHLEATVTGPQGFEARFRWHLFYEYVEGGQEVRKLSDVHPVAVPGRDSLMRFIEFDAVAVERNKRLEWVAGRHTVVVDGWVNSEDRRRKPNLRAVGHLVIPESAASLLREFKPVQPHAVRFALREWLATGPFLDRVLENKSWPAPDEFPAHQEVADDLEHLLAWSNQRGRFEAVLPRLRSRARERDAAIAELRAARFLEGIGFVVTRWEPKVGSRSADFEIRWNETKPILVEIKQPTFESELSKKERESGRKNRPRYVSGEVRSFDTRVEVRRAAESAASQLSREHPALLVIVDKLFRSPVKDLRSGELAALLAQPTLIGLGGILCIDTNWLKDDGTGIDYQFLFEASPIATGKPWEIPSQAREALSAASSARN